MRKDSSQWFYQLTAEDMGDLENAARHYLSLARDIGEIQQEDFPLIHFRQHLENLKEKLLTGVGVELIRGLPVESYNKEFVATIFCGIGAHLGSAR